MTVDVVEVFRKCGAIKEGHFILSSGLHSPVFLQKSLVFMHPDKTELICRELAGRIREIADNVEFIVSPALGGLIPGYETARHLGIPALWVEREDGEFRLRRFDLPMGSKVFIVEDILTTGQSTRETIESLKIWDAEVLGCGCLINRSDGVRDIDGIPLVSLAEYRIPVYESDDLPDDLRALSPVKPGSR